MEGACIYSLAFSKGEQPDWLAVSSDKGTIHIFSLQQKMPLSPDSAPNGAPERDNNQPKNPLSALSFVSVSYLSALGPHPMCRLDRSSSCGKCTCSQSRRRLPDLLVKARPLQDTSSSGLGGQGLVSQSLSLQSILPVSYFASERSFAQLRLREEAHSVVGFGQHPNTINVVSAKGSFYTANFDTVRGGLCSQTAYHSIFDDDHT